VHLSQPAVAERVHALEQAGIIKGYHAEVDSTQLGFPISAMVLVEARRVHETDAVVKIVKDLPDVLSCHKITGEYGLLLHVITSSLARLNQILQFISTYSPPTTSIILQSIFTRRTIRVAEK
jgi:Lrp/AsnC family leucine-responsive transcriptional regulator